VYHWCGAKTVDVALELAVRDLSVLRRVQADREGRPNRIVANTVSLRVLCRAAPHTPAGQHPSIRRASGRQHQHAEPRPRAAQLAVGGIG
jgi:hypothetical protein